MTLIAYAVPILPGQEDRVRSFGAELERQGLRERYEQLNSEAGITRHAEWIQQSPTGAIRLVVFDSDAPGRVGRSFIDGDAYDDWCRNEVRTIHGFDPADVQDPPAGPFWVWESPE